MISFLGFCTPVFVVSIYFIINDAFFDFFYGVTLATTVREYGGIFTFHFSILRYFSLWILVIVFIFNYLKYAKYREDLKGNNVSFLLSWLSIGCLPFITTAFNGIYFLLILANPKPELLYPFPQYNIKISFLCLKT